MNYFCGGLCCIAMEELKQLETLKKQIAKRVQSILESKGWKQQDLADKLKKPKSFVSAIVHSTANLTLRTIVELEGVLGEKIVKIEPKLPKK